MSEQIVLIGKNGKRYVFDVFPKNTKFKPDQTCLYAFLAPHYEGYKVLYIGQTTDLAKRLVDHHKWVEALLHGFESIAVYPMPAGCSLDTDERNLIEHYSPPCNEMLVP